MIRGIPFLHMVSDVNPFPSLFRTRFDIPPLTMELKKITRRQKNRLFATKQPRAPALKKGRALVKQGFLPDHANSETSRADTKDKDDRGPCRRANTQ